MRIIKIASKYSKTTADVNELSPIKDFQSYNFLAKISIQNTFYKFVNFKL